MSIVSLAEAKTFLGLTSATAAEELGRLNLLHRLVEQCVERHLGTRVEQASYTEFLPDERLEAGREALLPTIGTAGETRRVLQLAHVPVRSVSEVYVDAHAAAGQGAADFGAETLLAAGVDYYLDVEHDGLSRTGHLIRRGANWPSRGRTVKVVYTAGWTRAELDGHAAQNEGNAADIKLAVLHAMRHTWHAAGNGQAALRSERLGDYAAEYVAGSLSLPPESLALLQPFVRYAAV